MNAAARIFLEEFRDRALRIGGFEQFKVNLPYLEKCGAHLLRADFFTVFALQAQGLFIIRNGFIQGPDGNSQMINFLKHKPIGLPEGWRRFARPATFWRPGQRSTRLATTRPESRP